MSNLAQFIEYAAAFETAYQSNDWHTIDQYFAENCVYNIGLRAFHTAQSRGRNDTVQWLADVTKQFDKRFEKRVTQLTDGPHVEGDDIRFSGTATYTHEGLPDLVLTLEEVVTYQDGLISGLEDRYSQAMQEEVIAYYLLYGQQLGLPKLALTEVISPEIYMRAAMLEGRKARALCDDNPPVGCVVTRRGNIVATGHTNRPGEHHAEAMALAQLPDNLNDHTFYVTLEPCSFVGRTPSCAQSLIDRNAGKVCVGMIDPHPRNQGVGIDMLRAKGITVEVGLLQNEVECDLSPYFK